MSGVAGERAGDELLGAHAEHRGVLREEVLGAIARRCGQSEGLAVTLVVPRGVVEARPPGLAPSNACTAVGRAVGVIGDSRGLRKACERDSDRGR